MNRRGFTLLELLIVMGIIAILATTLVRNFGGFDAQAKVTATKSNLEALRTSINLFRAKEGEYPKSLGDLTTTYYFDAGIKKPYLKELPVELISDKRGNNTSVDQSSKDVLSGLGGWAYITDTAEVKINVSGELGKRWDEYAKEIPSEW